MAEDKQYKDPLAPNDKVFPVEDWSWLGRWSDNGWAIKIEPKLTDQGWRVFSQHSEETWDSEVRQYSPQLGLSLLARLFPDHKLELKYPQCGKRLVSTVFTKGGLPVHTVCDSPGVVAAHTDEAGGSRVCIVRCEAHAGQL